MSLPRFSVNQSLFVNLVSVILLIIGMITVFGTNREIFPNVDFDIVSITTAYPGATPVDVEKLITVPIEKELKEVDGIDEISSSSASGVSFLIVKIDPDESNKQKVIRDIQSAVDRVKDLPKDIAADPIVTEITNKQYPVIEVSLSGKMDEKKMHYYADALEDLIEDLPSVARITKSGYRDREIQVRVDPVKMRDQYLSFDEIEQALSTRNVSLPAGELNTEAIEYSVRTTGEFQTADEVAEVIVRANDLGNWIRIKDVADVFDSFKKETIVYKTLGTRSINLVVLKKEKGDAITLVDDIKATCNRFLEHIDDDLQISYVNDYSFFARRRLNVLKNNGWASLVLVIASMLLFLQPRVVFMTVLGIPIAFLTTFIAMGMLGITINLVSMFGLIIVLGMLVDDGIIVAENVYRHLEEGMPPRRAAVMGAEEVMGAVTVAIMTTIAAFSPLLFMTGILGKFIRNIPTVIIIALVASLAEALIILPSHLADFMKAQTHIVRDHENDESQRPWLRAILRFYTRIVTAAVNRKYKVLGGFTVALIVSAILANVALKFILFPDAGIDFFFIRAEAPIGTPLVKTNELITPIEEIVSELPGDELDTYVTSVGKMSEDRNDPYSQTASHLAQITVYLYPEHDRVRKADEIIEEVRNKIKAAGIGGFTDLRFDKAETGPPVGKAVEAKIRGEDFNVLDKIAFEFIDYLKKLPGTTDIAWDHKPGKEEILVSIDHKKATYAGVSVSQIAKTVRAVFEGNIATKIKPVKAEEETDVTVMFPESSADDLDVFENILVRNNQGNLVPLHKIAEIKQVPGTTAISHLDGKRVVTASANVDTNKTTSLEVNRKLQEKFKDISQRYLGYSVEYQGEQKDTVESLQSLLKAFFYAFLVVYLILASFFRSLVQPFVVMLAIPFGLIGVVFAFIVHGMPLSFMAILGIVGLNGIVVNDSIVLVDKINNLRREGLPRRDSIIKAGQMRIRPVLLTTITTVGGLSTVAYGIGGKDPFLVPMALSICWGIAFATVLTLIVIPCIYSIIDDITVKLTRHSSLITTDKVNNHNGNPWLKP
ncbi:MAG: efflux RND transporter permease subunit [Candidatus Omnitrophica bacterium]|nr:efflux RND transporter permease subunit [Candidatus Omnitrophota bacterium]